MGKYAALASNISRNYWDSYICLTCCCSAKSAIHREKKEGKEGETGIFMTQCSSNALSYKYKKNVKLIWIIKTFLILLYIFIYF